MIGSEPLATAVLLTAFGSLLAARVALIAPSGSTRIEAGDYVYVIAPLEHRSHVELLFGRPEDH